MSPTPAVPAAAPVVQPLRFTGERFVEGAGVEITYDHLLRYFFALQFVEGQRVLELASGEGYGASLLASKAAHVEAIEMDAPAVAHARARYGGQRPNLRFQCASAQQALAALEPESFDVVTAFEFIEHVSAEQQLQVLEGVRRVLKPGGVLLMSTPDKRLYTDVTLSRNPFHIHELYRPEFAQLLGTHFAHVRMLEQSCFTGSVIFEDGAQQARLAQMVWTDLIALQGHSRPGLQGSGTYLVAVASNASLEQRQPVLLVDLARKLIGEHLYAQHLELEKLKGESLELRKREAERLQQTESQLSRELTETRENLAQNQQILDRLLVQMARQHDELTQLRRLQSEVTLLRENAHHVDTLRQEEIARRTHLERMLSVRMVLRAKGVLDRAPRLKGLLRNALHRVSS